MNRVHFARFYWSMASEQFVDNLLPTTTSAKGSNMRKAALNNSQANKLLAFKHWVEVSRSMLPFIPKQVSGEGRKIERPCCFQMWDCTAVINRPRQHCPNKCFCCRRITALHYPNHYINHSCSSISIYSTAIVAKKCCLWVDVQTLFIHNFKSLSTSSPAIYNIPSWKSRTL